MTRVYVVGAGPAGCWVARRLTESGHEVTLITGRGPKLARERFGECLVYYGLGPGGSARYSMGNLGFWGPKRLERRFRRALADLSVPVERAPDDVLNDLDLELERAARDLGLEVERTPKAIDFERCTGCGRCLKCPEGAKWNPMREVPDGVEVIEDHCLELRASSGRVTELVLEERRLEVSEDDAVVLSAGCPGTPDLLRRSGVEIDAPLFADLYVHVIADLEARPGLQMPVIVHEDEFMISPHRTSRHPDRYALMVKIRDELAGSVAERRKPVTAADATRIAEGCALAGELLRELGARVETVTRPAGAHPGGALAERLDREYGLEGFENLHVVDVNALDEALGRPTIGAILALAEDFADRWSG